MNSSQPRDDRGVGNQPANSAIGKPAGGKPDAGNADKSKAVRTLYGSSRRKLAPGDVKGVKREE